jgi:hypothetical protein
MPWFAKVRTLGGSILICGKCSDLALVIGHCGTLLIDSFATRELICRKQAAVGQHHAELRQSPIWKDCDRAFSRVITKSLACGLHY